MLTMEIGVIKRREVQSQDGLDVIESFQFLDYLSLREPYELVCLVWGIFFELRYLVDIFGFRSSLPLIWNWLGFNLICGDNWMHMIVVSWSNLLLILFSRSSLLSLTINLFLSPLFYLLSFSIST